MVSKPRAATLLAGGMLAAEAWSLRRRTGSLIGLRTIVRCRRGHLFTTVWIPGASVKAIRLGPWRVQRCPVGHHLSVVTPVRLADLSDAERETAGSHRGRLIP